MKVDSITDVGLVRKHNEDDVRTGLLSNSAWAVVCDGMGGSNAGEVASQNGVRVISDEIAANYTADASGNAIKYLLHGALCNANTVIFNLSEEYEEFSGMGTTAVAALMTRGAVHVCHVGDSRAYLIREDSIQQITKDHSLIQQLVDAGTVTAEEAKNHPQRNLITRCLGVHATVESDYGEYPVQPGDLVLLCSDGLTGYLEDQEILEYAKQMDPSALIRQLVATALERGGGDNVTIAVIEN